MKMARKSQFYHLDSWVQILIKMIQFYLYKVIIGLPFRLGDNVNSFPCIQSILFFIRRQGYWYG